MTDNSLVALNIQPNYTNSDTKHTDNGHAFIDNFIFVYRSQNWKYKVAMEKWLPKLSCEVYFNFTVM